MTFERVTIDPGLMGGVPTICGLRIPVATVVSMVAEGMTVEVICQDLFDLSPEDVSESLRYAAEPVRIGDCCCAHRHEAVGGQQSLSAACRCARGVDWDVVRVRKLGL
jgi:uncharacterized protein (DUF433 family)